MELRKKRGLLLLLLPIGVLTDLVALETVSDPNTRHIVAAFGAAVALVGLVLRFRTRSLQP